MIVQWRTMAGYAATPYTVENHCPTLDAQRNLMTAIELCEQALKAGPSAGIIAKKAASREKLKRAGSKGGEARSTKAREQDALVVEAKRVAEKYGFPEIPNFDPKKWEFGADTDKGTPRFYFARVGSKTEVCVELIRDTKTRKFGQTFPEYWRICRYWPSSFDDNASAILEDDVVKPQTLPTSSTTLRDAIRYIERVLASDPRTWNLNDVDKFQD